MIAGSVHYMDWTRGKSELPRAGWSVTRTVSRNRDKESAAENKPPRSIVVRPHKMLSDGVRVKR